MKMKSVLVTLSVWVLCVQVVVEGSKSGEELLLQEVRDRVRYVKDDGVDKIVDETRSVEEALHREVGIIANTREKFKHEEQTAKIDEIKDDLHKYVDHDGKDVLGINHDNTKEEIMKANTKSYSNLQDDKSENKSTGVPVFITDDGKTIQLPQSDVLYNPKTGEILIRNREHHDDPTVTAETKGVNNIFSVQNSDSFGIKNLQGFVIDDSMNKKVLYPVTISTIEKNDFKNIPQETTTDRVVSDKNTTLKIVSTTFMDNNNNNTHIVEETITNNTLSIKTDSALLETVKDNISYVESIDQGSADVGTTMSPSVELKSRTGNDEMHNTNIEITVPLIKNFKSAVGRSNEKAFDTKVSQEKTESEHIIQEHSEDEPIYKYPLNENNEEADSHPNTDEKVHEKAVKSIEYDPHLFQVPETPIIDESEIAKIKNSAISSDTETTKSSVTVVTGQIVSDIAEQNNVVRAKMMNIEQVDGKVVDELVDNSDLKLKASTTEKPEPINVLKNFLEDIFLRGPIAILVDVEPKNLIRTRDLWTTMESKAGNLDIEDVVLFGYDIDGITTMSYHKGSRQKGFNDLDANKSLSKALYEITSTSKYYSGPGNPRMALSKAVQLLPYDSAIFIFEADNGDSSSNGGVGGGAPTPVPGKLIKQLIAKRIKIYCISSGQAWASGAAITSGGSNIYLPATATLHGSSSTLQDSPLSLQPQHNLQHHILYHAHPHPPHYREMRALSVYYDTDDDDELVYDEQQTLILAHNTMGTTSISIPLDSGIRVLTINITEQPKMAILRGPHAAEINLLEPASISNFSVGSKQLPIDSTRSICVTLNMIEKTEKEDLLDEEEDDMIGGESSEYQGTWKLHLIENDRPLDVKVTAETNLRIMAKILKADSMPGQSEESYNLKIAVGGSVSSIREAEILDVHGNPLGKLSHRGHEETTESDTTEIESLRALESGTVVKLMKLPEDLHPGDMFRVRVEGKNDRDEPFVRISSVIIMPLEGASSNIDPVEVVEVLNAADLSQFNATFPNNQNKGNLQTMDTDIGYDHIDGGRAFNGSTNEKQQTISTTSLEVQPLTIIQIGMASKLYGSPGTVLQIHFEVTNRRENSVFFRFGARDDKYFLRSLTPQTQWINAGQTLNVVLTVGITSSAENNIRDTITFTANGLEPATLSLYVYVETDGTIASDRARPVLRHSFIGECLGYLGEDNCKQRFWGLDITARDTDSGVMRITATPGLVYYQNNFFAGARGEARARFTSNCCTHQVIVAATDVAGNMASYEVNVAQYFTPATIAAIVLGVILAIILIIVIILLIRLCIRRRKTSRDLPSYSTQRAA